MTVRLALLASVLAAMGCVKKDSGSIGQAEAQSAGDSLGTSIEDGAGAFGPVNAGAAADAACVTLSGNTADADLDSIPVSATLTFNCTATSLGYTGTLTGTESVMDNQPAAIAWAFAANADMHASLTGPLGASITRDWSGDITATQASLVGPFALERNLDATTVFKTAGGRTTTVTEMNAWTITYTPQATWTPGGVVITGSLTATGTWDATVGSKSANATLATPTALTLTPSCATRVTGGVLTGTYEGDKLTRTLTVSWTGCGARTVTYTER
jgi:hypothetical protein